MNSNFQELSLKLNESSHNIKIQIQLLESIVNEYSKYNNKSPEDKLVLSAKHVIKESIEKYSSLHSTEFFYENTNVLLQEHPGNLKHFQPNIIKLCNSAMNQGILTIENSNKYLLSLLFHMNKIQHFIIKERDKLSKKLSKFLSTDEKKQLDADIYINLLKSSKKIPIVEGLAIASNEKISKSSWDRKIKNDRFLYIVIEKIEKLIKRTKEEEKINFYTTVHYTLSKKMEIILDRKSKYKKLFQIPRKRNFENGFDHNNNPSQIVSDKNQFNDWVGEK